MDSVEGRGCIPDLPTNGIAYTRFKLSILLSSCSGYLQWKA